MTGIGTGQGGRAGVPNAYTGLTASGDQFLIQKGNLNRLRLRPQILNEHTESSRTLMSTVAAGNIVGQVFKASHDNINGLNLTLNSTPTLIVDDFESYANDAAIQAAWVANSVNLAAVETVIVDAGTQSMKLPGGGTIGDEWVLTIAPTDLTGYTGSLQIQQTISYSFLKLRFFVGDGVNTASAPIVVTAGNVWQRIEIAADQLVDDAGATDITAITEVGLRVEARRTNEFFYIDQMEAAPAPGSLGLKLWDMGTTPPVSSTTSLDDGTQYVKLGDAGISGAQVAEVEFPILGGFRQYLVDGFIAGVALEIPTNEILNTGNYYAVTLHYVDTDIDVYGPDPAYDNYYENGYAFNAADEATAIVATGVDEDLQFGIFSAQEVFVVSIFSNFGDPPGDDSRMLVNVEDDNMMVTSVVVQGVRGQQLVAQAFDPPYVLVVGGKFEINYNDDQTDDVSEVEYSIQYLFEPQSVNG